jgi:hypothetical protein
MNLSAAASSAACLSISAPCRAWLGLPLPLHRALARFDHAAADAASGLAGRRFEQLLRRDRGHPDVQIDAVQQRPAQLALVARHLVRRAAAGLERAAEVAAGAGVHRRDELEAGREFGPSRGARDGDGAGLQRLAQRFEGRPRELGNSSRNSTPWCASEISPGEFLQS